MPPAGFEPTISAGERPQTYALDRVAAGTGKCTSYAAVNKKKILRIYRQRSCGQFTYKYVTHE